MNILNEVFQSTTLRGSGLTVNWAFWNYYVYVLIFKSCFVWCNPGYAYIDNLIHFPYLSITVQQYIKSYTSDAWQYSNTTENTEINT